MGKLTDAVTRNDLQEVQRLLAEDYREKIFMSQHHLINEETNKNGDHPLHIAAGYEFTQIIELLLKADANVNQTNNNGCTSLYIAAHQGNVGALQALLKARAKVQPDYLGAEVKGRPKIDQPDNSGRTPLYAAAHQGKVETLQVLLKAGAKIDQPDKNGETPLYVAAEGGHVEVLQVLLKAGAKIDQPDKNGLTPLYVAKKKGHVSIVKLLEETLLNRQLYTAAHQGNVEALQALLKAGAKIDQPDKNGLTPLYVAAEGGHVEVLQSLLKAGAKIDQPDKNGETPLYVAAEGGHVEVLQSLLKAGANVNQTTNYGGAPLHAAAYRGKVEALQALLKAGAKIDQANNNGRTPLHFHGKYNVEKYNVERYNVEIVQTLLKAGANVDQPDNDGHTPLYRAEQDPEKGMSDSDDRNHIIKLLQEAALIRQLYRAAYEGKVEIVQKLLKEGVNVNQATDGWMPLHAAAQNGHVEIVQGLLKAGANVEANNKGQTPLSLAKGKGHTEIVSLLETQLERQKNASNMVLLNAQLDETQKLLEIYRKTSGVDPSYLTGVESFLKDILLYSQANSSTLVTPVFAETLKNIEEQQNKLHLLIKPKPPVNLPKYQEKTLQSMVKKESTKAESSPLLLDKASAAFSFTPFTLKYNELTIGKELGRGSFGVVYQGTYRYNDVAIKQLLLTKPSIDALKEFKEEMNLMASLRCPQIVSLHGVYLEPLYGIVMEYMSNGSLYQVLHSNKPLDWPVRYSIAMDMAKGVAFLHKENILHRDLKSLNVLLDEHMKAKLTDFGLAKLKNETAGVSSNNNNSPAVGSLLWMAPELFKRGIKCTPKSDMYSLGMTLWELSSRKRPFEDAVNTDMAVQWIKDGELNEIPTDCPSIVSKLITLCWDRETSKRPTADETVKQLLNAKNDFEGVASKGTRPILL